MASSTMGGPGAASIHVRAGWSLGGVQDRYIFSDPGSDQFVGRCLNAFSLSSTSFATLPPHFAPDQNLFDGDQEAGWRSILPGYVELPMCFKSALRFLLASLVFHQDWLRAKFTHQHPLFQSPVFTSGHVARLKPSVLIGEFEHPVSGLVATGVPPSISQLRAICELKADVVALRECVSERSDAVLAAVNLLPEACATAIAQRVRVDGMREVTAQDVSQIVSNQLSPIALLLNQLLTRGVQPPVAAPVDDAKQPDGADGVQPDPAEPAFDQFHWGGRMCRVVRRGFTFPL